MSDESVWIDRAQSAEAKLHTYQEQVERMKETVRHVCDTLGARMRADGSADIDFERFVERLGMENALQVRAIIDETYHVSGAAGEKPKIKVKAAAA